MINVAVIDDNFREVEQLINIIKSDADNYTVKYFDASNNDEIYQWITAQINPVVLLDLFFNGEESGELIFEEIKKINSYAPIFIFTSAFDLGTEQKYKDLGCYDYIVKNRVRREDSEILLQRIKKACEVGSKFNASFEICRKTWLSNPGDAIFILSALLDSSGQNNLKALYQLHEWIKALLFNGLEEIPIGLPKLFRMLENNCVKIEALQQDVQTDILLDKAMSQIHLGKTVDAKDTLIVCCDLIGLAPQQKRLFCLLSAFHYLSSDEPVSHTLLFDLIGVNFLSNNYEPLLEGLYLYNKPLWNDAIAEYIHKYKEVQQIDVNRILTLFDDSSNQHVLESDVLRTRDPNTINDLFELFITGVQNAQNQDVKLASLYNCSRFLFDKASIDYELTSDKEFVCSVLNEFTSLLYLSNKSEEWMHFVDTQIALLGTTNENIIKDVLTRPGRDSKKNLELLLKMIRSLLRKGLTTNAVSTLKKYEYLVSDTTEEDVFGDINIHTNKNYRYYRFGELFEEKNDNNTALHYFEQAISGFLSDISKPELQKQKSDILLYVRVMLDKLINFGADISILEGKYRSLASSNIRNPLPLDGKHCAIAGGHPDLATQVATLEEHLGGKFTYYGIDKKRIQSMNQNIRSGGINFIFYLTNYTEHRVDNEFMPVLKEYNNTQNNKVELVQLRATNISGIVSEIKTHFSSAQL